MTEQSLEPLHRAGIQARDEASGTGNFFRSVWRSDSLRALLLLVLVSLTLYLKRPDAFLNPQLWAEDGKVFLTQQRDLGAKALLVPYAGYVHLVPRLAALFAAQFPLYHTPAIYYGFAFFIFLFTALFVFFRSREIGSNGFLFALAPLLIPQAGEVILNLTNTQWVLALILPFLYVQPPLSGWRYTLLTIILFILAGLTGPFAVLSCPLLLYRLKQIRNRNIYEMCFLVVAILVIVVQGWCLLKGHKASASASLVWTDWLKAAFEQFGAYLYFGKYLPERLPLATAVVAAVLLLITLLAMLRLRIEKRSMAFVLFSYGLIIFGAALGKSAHAPHMLHPLGFGQRYYFLPYIGFFYFYLILAREPQAWQKWLGRVALALVIYSGATSFRIAPQRDFHWEEHLQRLELKGRARIPIPPGWMIDLYWSNASSLRRAPSPCLYAQPPAEKAMGLDDNRLISVSRWGIDPTKLEPSNEPTLSVLDQINGHISPGVNAQVIIDSRGEAQITIRGWAIDRIQDQPATGIFVCFEGSKGSVNLPVDYCQNRPDVAQVFKEPEYHFSGFSLALPTAALEPDAYTLTLKVVTPDRKHYFKPPHAVRLRIK